MNWQELSSTSYYKTALAVKDELQQSHLHEAMIGIEELIDAWSRSEKRALRSQLRCPSTDEQKDCHSTTYLARSLCRRI